MTLVDGAVLGILLAFAGLGAVRGPVRAGLSLGLLLLAFGAAPYAPAGLAVWIGKLTGRPPAESEALAWAVALGLGLVSGGLLLASFGERLRRAGARGRGGRLLGAGLGALQGAGIVLLLGYVMLAWIPSPSSGAGPALRRETPRPPTAVRARPNWRQAARHSIAAHWLVAGGEAVRTVVALPPWIEQAMVRVGGDVRASPDPGP